MGLKAFRCGANVIAYVDNNKKYAMTCAWALMIDYDKIGMLIGGQSETGNNLKVGMNVGVSSLKEGQEEIARILGTRHSSNDKCANVEFIQKGEMLLVPNSKVMMECTVSEIKKFGADSFAILNVNNFEQDETTEFLDGYNPKCYHE